MRDRKLERTGFYLRLARPLNYRARLLAAQEGVSLNHFISSAVADKIGRLEAMLVQEAPTRQLDESLPAESASPDSLDCAPEG